METLKIDLRKLMTIRSYSVKHGVSVQSVYNWVKEGRIKLREIDGVKFIEL
jgi:predicted site-specific integrase-resolvase